jgi:pimeloyl-ACP methyl ester carboxylesterase
MSAVTLPAGKNIAMNIASVDHYISTLSGSPTLEGMPITLFLRERISDSALRTGRRSVGSKVALFVHGGSFPGVPDFDLPYKDFSWLAYLAAAGFDAFAVDLTGYGKSSRPYMDDARNTGPEQRRLVGVGPGPAPFPQRLTSLASDWADIDAAVDFIRTQTGAERVHLVGWSGGGPRIGGYAAQHPEKVGRVLLVAPAYFPTDAVNTDPAGEPMQIATREMVFSRFEAGTADADQYDPLAREAFWQSNMEMDPVGATWGPGVVRAPTLICRYRWPQHLVPRFVAPTMLIAGELDAEVKAASVRQLFKDIGSERKVLIDVEGGTHFLPHERRRDLLFEASLEWLSTGTYRGATQSAFHIARDRTITEVGMEHG